VIKSEVSKRRTMAITGGAIAGAGLGGLAASMIVILGLGGVIEPLLITGLGFGLGVGMLVASSYRE
jgi:hypothetical protein